MRTSIVATVMLAASAATPVALSAPTVSLIPPVDAPVVRAFDPPTSEYGPGHRGVDYAVEPGTPVRAAGSGTVSFAGHVAGVEAVTIDHGAGIESTYTDLSDLYVSRGDSVSAGSLVGAAGDAHPGTAGLHFGVRVEGDYVDPAALLGPVDVTGAIHLAPAFDIDRDDLGALGGVLLPFNSGTNARTCESSARVGRTPPNDNVAVAVAGLGSHTRGGTGAAIYENGPESFGYPSGRIYRFSYRGSDGPRLHEPYPAIDTYGDVRAAAARLRALLVRVADRHPGAHVDLIAHSQGGIVARTYLAQVGEAWDPALPPVDHLVTFSSPHGGAPAAGETRDIDRDSFGGSTVLDALSRWSRSGGVVPDPRSTAVAQLAPGSSLLRSLDREDVGFGTRALALAIPNDPVVPATTASIPNESFRVVSPEGGLLGHEAVITSAEARAAAYAFLADAAPTCPSAWDGELGRVAGSAIEWGQGRISDAYVAAEERVATGALALVGVPPRYGRLVYRVAAGTARALRSTP